MKKRILALVLAATMVFSLAACGSGDGGSTTAAPTEGTTAVPAGDETTAAPAGDETTAAPAGDETPAAPAGDGTIKVGMVTDVGGINDNSFNQTSWEGLNRAASELGIEVTYMESKTDADYMPNIESLIDAECDLIICVGFMLSEATKTAAENYPDQKFAIIDDSANAELPNVACLMFEQAQASYLVGIVAGMMTEKNNVGFVIGMNTGPMNQFGYGYCAGVLDANPEATIQQYNANNFGDAGVGKTAAKDMVTKGADIIFHAAGGTGSGVIDACAEEGIWAIGVDTDQNSLAPDTVITSAMKRVDNASYDIAKAVLEGTYTSGVHTYGLTDGGVDLAPTQTLLPAEVLAAVEQAKQDIIDGKITVPDNQAAFEEKYGEVYELD